jgi:two-component system cell cycle sensor histidine kinase/response regulator CckA
MGAEKDDERADAGFRLLCETCGVGFWHIAPGGRTVYMNATMASMLELDSPDAIGEATFHEFFTADSLERMSVEHDKRAHGSASTYEVELLGRRGGIRNVVISGAPLWSGGVLIGRIGTFTDITDRKAAELALRESEHRMRSLFGASVDAIGVAHAGTHLMVNPAYLKMFGFVDERELLERPILDLIAPSERSRVLDFAKHRAEGRPLAQHYLTRGVRRDGEEFALEVHASSYVERGEVYSVVILRDVTERLRLEEQLRESQKMDALGRLAGGVAHDFNNLLMVMTGCAELIALDAHAGAEARANAELIRSTADRAASLTRQLLALSRRQVIDPKVIDLDAVVTEMSVMLRRLIGPRIELVVENGAQLGRVRVDPSQIQQVVMNLCVNARDAMPDGGRIAITTRNARLDEAFARTLGDVAPGPFVHLLVTDNGVGMDLETKRRLFEPFFTTKPLGEGTGLGLSTVYGIVKQSGGHVSVASTKGKGSEFSVYLPIVGEPLTESRRETEAPRAETATTILLVEDEPQVRRLLEQFLKRAGYHVLAAPDAQQALELFEQHAATIDVVLTDILMPGLTGVELARALDERRSGLPILFMSGYAHDEGADVESRPGSAFLPKPFSMPQLTAKLRALLDTKAIDPTPGHRR